MNTYKPGDVVRRKHPSPSFPDGHTYLVDWADKQTIRLAGDTPQPHDFNYWDPHLFELVTPAAVAQASSILDADSMPDEAKREDGGGWWDIDPAGLLEQGDIAAAAGFGLEQRVQARRKPAGS